MFPLRDDNPVSITPFVTVAVLAACVLIFFWQASFSEAGQQQVIYALGLVPAVLLEGAKLPPELAWVPAQLTLFTSMFLHGGWLHLLGNMLYLWIFGNNVEDAMGHGRFVVFYLACGLAAAFAQALPNPDSTIPMVGASGAISGVLGAYLLLYPRAQVLVLVPLGILTRLVYLPALWVLGFWFLIQLISQVFSAEGEGGVAFRAHIGGFIAGMVLIPFFKRADVPLFHRARHHAFDRWG